MAMCAEGFNSANATSQAEFVNGTVFITRPGLFDAETRS